MKNKYALAISVGIIMLIISMALSMLLTMTFPSLQAEYETPAFRPWDDPLMSLFFLYPIVLGIVLTYLWFKTRSSWKNGLDFGIAFGILMSVPMFIVNYSSFNFSLLMVGSWTVFGFINVLVAGMVLEKLGGLTPPSFFHLLL